MNSDGGSLDANIFRRHYVLITIIAMSSPATLDAHSTSSPPPKSGISFFKVGAQISVDILVRDRD